MADPTIAVIAGDGIGQEVVPAAIQCLDRVAELHGFRLAYRHLDWGSEHYFRTGAMMPPDGIETLSRFDAIFLGAVGHPDLPDTETLWGLLIPIRRQFAQYVNLRPVRTLAGIAGPLASTTPIDFVIVRENNEGEYSEIGGRLYRGTLEESAHQTAVFTLRGVQRIAAFAARLASTRGGVLVSATKSNGIIHSMPFWDEVVARVATSIGVEVDSVLIDALAARMVLRPASLDVVVASNLFGDILSDLGSAITGSIGVAPSANLNPERQFPSLFEPVHGSAPDIAGLGIANPVGQIWSGALMLEHLGFTDAASHLTRAFESVLARGIATRDLGGSASTATFTRAVVDTLGA
ncbi:MAG TPA: tartrate dehydrogenase [Galbitalea sp.]|jgi:tartrate dehydrogenase/decarboxylase/D-malate dehydrogenase